jgi:DNA segregation ATPase FtsK/SpoIIIE-like protein
MKTIRILFLSLILLGVAAGTGFAATSLSAGIHIGPSGHASVDVGFFDDDLAAYGNWVQQPSYGWAWRPHAVARSWRPYRAGHWVMTDEGWTWISNEPYGWATYHYGRWYDDPNYGWEWIPGNEWAPAWVAWQEGGNYIGWAPLPPTVDFRTGVDLSVSLAPDVYLFVPERQFLAPQLSGYYIPQAQYGRIFPATRNITRYNIVNNRVFNQGVPVDRFQQVVGRPVPRYQIADLNADQRHQGARVAQNRISFFRPQVDKAQVAPPPNRPIARHAVIAGAVAGAAVAGAAIAAHHANQTPAAANVPPAARQQTKAERQQVAQAPPSPKQHGRAAREAQPAVQPKQQQAAQQQAAQQQKNQQRQEQQQAVQQKGAEQKAQRQAAQQQSQQRKDQQQQAAQQKGQQRQAQQQAPQQKGEQQKAQRQAPQQQGQQRQAQKQAPQPPKNQDRNQGKPPAKPQDEKQKPPPQ